MKFLTALAVCSLTALVACSSSAVPPTSAVAPPSGTIVFVREHPNGESLYTVRADGAGERLLLTSPACCAASWSHRGDRIMLTAFDTTRGNLVTTATVRADGSGYNVLPLASPGLNLGPGVWSPDDSRIAFEGWDDRDPSRNGIYAADSADGRNLRRVTSNAERMDEIPVSYSPDGSKIMFWRGPFGEEPGQLFLVGADGGDPTRLSATGMTVIINNGDPGGWSPDGTHISFAAASPTSSDPNRSAVFVAAGDGSNPKQISDWGEATTNARWSPKGDWIVFDKNNGPGGRHSLFLIHSDGNGSKVVGSLVGVCCAVWSPDGNRLLFTRGPSDDASDLWTEQLDGTHLTQLTHSPATLRAIGWSGVTT